LQEAQYAAAKANLAPCRYCSRRFAPDRVGVHERVCQRLDSKPAAATRSYSPGGAAARRRREDRRSASPVALDLQVRCDDKRRSPLSLESRSVFCGAALESRPLEWRSAGTGLCSYRVRGVDGSCAKRLTVEFYTVVMLLTFILIIISIPSPTHSFIPRFKPSFSANPSHRSLSFSSSGLTTWIPRTFTVTCEHIRFFTFSVFFHFLVVGSVR